MSDDGGPYNGRLIRDEIVEQMAENLQKPSLYLYWGHKSPPKPLSRWRRMTRWWWSDWKYRIRHAIRALRGDLWE